VTVPRDESGNLKTAVDIQARLFAPLAADAVVGQVRVFAGGQTVATAPLHPLQSVAAGGWWRRLVDTVRLWFA
jgi:D-alanyl-D-alanine carboxypeptidase (penicillin-binding protein 5/6)